MWAMINLPMESEDWSGFSASFPPPYLPQSFLSYLRFTPHILPSFSTVHIFLFLTGGGHNGSPCWVVVVEEEDPELEGTKFTSHHLLHPPVSVVVVSSQPSHRVRGGGGDICIRPCLRGEPFLGMASRTRPLYRPLILSIPPIRKLTLDSLV